MKNIDVCAVVTTFEPKESLLSNLNLLLSQVSYVIIVNDSGQDFEILNNINSDRVLVINNKENFGIAKSLNIGCTRAGSLGFEYLLTLDDDSVLGNEYVHHLMDTLNYGNSCLVCGVYDSLAKVNESVQQKLAVITSGSLFKISDFYSIKGFSEDMFIDYVDFDFCLRLKAETKLDILVVRSATFTHTIGESLVDGGSSMKIKSFNHSPFRIYYQTRNVFFMIKRFHLSHPLFILYLSRNLIVLPMKILLADTDKSVKLKYYFKGLLDGIVGRVGKI